MSCGNRCDVAILITGPSGAGIIVVNISKTDSGLDITNGLDAALALKRLCNEGYKLECCVALASDAFVQYTFARICSHDIDNC